MYLRSLRKASESMPAYINADCVVNRYRLESMQNEGVVLKTYMVGQTITNDRYRGDIRADKPRSEQMNKQEIDE